MKFSKEYYGVEHPGLDSSQLVLDAVQSPSYFAEGVLEGLKYKVGVLTEILGLIFADLPPASQIEVAKALGYTVKEN